MARFAKKEGALKDKEYNALRRKIDRWAVRWKEELLPGWEIIFHYEREPLQNIEGNLLERSSGYTHFLWEYRSASISFNLLLMAERTDRQNENTVIHELCHCLVAELVTGDKRPDGEAHMERVVTDIVTSLNWVRDAAIKGKLPKPLPSKSEQ